MPTEDVQKGTHSVWGSTVEPLEPVPLEGHTSADVCIVGAGIAGMTTAYLLAREGKHVVVIDRGTIGAGETGRTTAHLSNHIDDGFTEMERLHGVEGSRLARESHGAAIDRIESIANDEQIDCDFVRVDGYLFRAPDQSPDLIDREYAAAVHAGVEVERVDLAPFGTVDTGPCLRFPRQAQFHPLKYLDGLARAIRRMDGRIFCRTQADEVTSERVVTSQGTINAEAVVVATNVPMHQRVGVHPKQAAYRTYALGLRVPTGAIVRALYWDTADPYHYVRLLNGHDNGQDVLIVGGEDHKTGQDEEQGAHFERLESWSRIRFPIATEVEFRWSGQVMETIDGLAYIGRSADGTYVATGDSGMGMTHGTIAGILLTDLILGRHNPWAKLYDPHRVRLAAASELARETLNVAARYADWVTGGDVTSVGEIRPGSGAIVRRGLQKLAVYRDDEGKVHACSAVCPHLGCIVAWNGVERSWDCPCHGSRFDAFGRVVHGPANRDLTPTDG
jgi:glycine/D-amino acid oxidase-like deaminating enzyme/nitrite reductase/ring-hydroxylating ferredoxin subunit